LVRSLGVSVADSARRIFRAPKAPCRIFSISSCPVLSWAWASSMATSPMRRSADGAVVSAGLAGEEQERGIEGAGEVGGMAEAALLAAGGEGAELSDDFGPEGGAVNPAITRGRH